MKKDDFLKIRLSREGKKRLETLAKQKGVSISQYVRLLTFREDDYQEVMKYLRKILYRAVQGNIAIEELCCELPAWTEKKRDAFIERVKAKVANEKP